MSNAHTSGQARLAAYIVLHQDLYAAKAAAQAAREAFDSLPSDAAELGAFILAITGYGPALPESPARTAAAKVLDAARDAETAALRKIGGFHIANPGFRRF